MTEAALLAGEASDDQSARFQTRIPQMRDAGEIKAALKNAGPVCWRPDFRDANREAIQMGDIVK
jgi:hypothetical protein